MVSSICQRLLDKQWKFYKLENVPRMQGIYVIGEIVPQQDPLVLYVGRSKDIHRRMAEHKRRNLAIDEYVKAQFRLNDGENLRIKWVRETNSDHKEKEYRKCIADKLGYWPVYNIKH